MTRIGSTRSNGTQDALEPQFECAHLGQTADGDSAGVVKAFTNDEEIR